MAADFATQKGQTDFEPRVVRDFSPRLHLFDLFSYQCVVLAQDGQHHSWLEP
jgi:hypothetical protein